MSKEEYDVHKRERGERKEINSQGVRPHKRKSKKCSPRLTGRP